MGSRYELPSELNIYSALESRDALLAWVSDRSTQAQEHLEVSAANVNEIDGSGLQLLASLGATQENWRLVDPSPAFAEACRALGFAQWLQEAAVDPAGNATEPEPEPKAKAKAKPKSRKESTA